ncbi:MAG TPA: methyltransferase domain-containing protein [Polyangia bacterium]|jgi:ubiquinone/menaquinone biosynthesis C-methylase UbiE
MSALATAEPWDLVAVNYAAEALPYFETFSREALRLAALPPRARVADVAAGPGTLSLLAAAEGATVSAIDLSPNMVAAFRARVAAAGLDAAVDVRVGDGQQLPFESGVFDAAFSMFGLMFFPDRAAGLREMKRVLKPGGRAIISSWIPFEGPFGVLLRTAAEIIPGLPSGGELALADEASITRELGEAGLTNAAVHRVAQELKAPSFDAFWTAMERTNAPLVLIKHRVGPERWQSLGPKIRDKVRQTLGDGPVTLGRGAFVGIGAA